MEFDILLEIRERDHLDFQYFFDIDENNRLIYIRYFLMSQAAPESISRLKQKSLRADTKKC